MVRGSRRDVHAAGLRGRRHEPIDAAALVASESAFDYFRATRDYLETHGKPVAFYSDKHSIFRVNSKDAAGGDGVTQFGRALSELNIDIICANSPQAKGRVERAFGTLQDRLVKELRLAGIATIAAANAWLPGFIITHNGRFGRVPANAKDTVPAVEYYYAAWNYYFMTSFADEISRTGMSDAGASVEGVL